MSWGDCESGGVSGRGELGDVEERLDFGHRGVKKMGGLGWFFGGGLGKYFSYFLC